MSAKGLKQHQSNETRTSLGACAARFSLFVTFLFVLALPASAWGPTTHTYLITKILGTENHDAVFGSTLPDFNGAARLRPRVDATIKHLTHYEFDRLAPSMFALGFSTHNGVWGADHFAHRYLEDEQSTYYATRKIKELSRETGLNLHLAEDVFEAAMDIRIAVDCGPWLGNLLRASARASGPENEQALVDAFAAPLAERAPELAPADAANALRWACRAHKTLMQAYGIQVTQSQGYMFRVGVPLLAKHLQCDYATASRHLEFAYGLCADWRPEMDQMAERVRKSLSESACRALLSETQPSGSPGIPD